MNIPFGHCRKDKLFFIKMFISIKKRQKMILKDLKMFYNVKVGLIWIYNINLRILLNDFIKGISSYRFNWNGVLFSSKVDKFISLIKNRSYSKSVPKLFGEDIF